MLALENTFCKNQGWDRQLERPKLEHIFESVNVGLLIWDTQLVSFICKREKLHWDRHRIVKMPHRFTLFVGHFSPKAQQTNVTWNSHDTALLKTGSVYNVELKYSLDASPLLDRHNLFYVFCYEGLNNGYTIYRAGQHIRQAEAANSIQE